MAEPIFPGLPDALHRMLASAEVAMRVTLEQAALQGEALAKVHAGEGGAHTQWDPSPSRKGSGPAVISGDLRRAVTHSEVEGSGERMSVRVGVADLPHRKYRTRKGTLRKGPSRTSAEIGKYLERDHDRPFLTPAIDEVESQSGGLIGARFFDAIEW